MTHLLVWPTRKTLGIEAFAMPGMPKCAPSKPPGLGGQTANGIFSSSVDEDMMLE